MPTLLETTTGLTGIGLHTWAGTNFDFWTWLIELSPAYASLRYVATDREVVWGGGIQRCGLVSGSVNVQNRHTPIQLELRIAGTNRDTVQPHYYPLKWSSVGFNISPGFQLTLKLWTF